MKTAKRPGGPLPFRTILSFQPYMEIPSERVKYFRRSYFLGSSRIRPVNR